MIYHNNRRVDEIHYRGRTISTIYYLGRIVFSWSPNEDQCCFPNGIWRDDYIWNDNSIWKD